MSFNLYNGYFIAFLLVFFLLLTTIYHSSQYLKNKGYKILLFVRIVAIIIIIAIFLHPILYLKKELANIETLTVYIDNSKSMKNNISLDSLNQMLDKIKESSLDKKYLTTFYLFGDSIRKFLDFNLDFSEQETNFKQFRNHVLDNKSTAYLLISDGLNPIEKNQDYNFGKKIDVLSIGGIDSSNQNYNIVFKQAYISSENNEIEINFKINNSKKINKKLIIDLYQKDKFILSHLIELSDKNNEYLGNFNIQKLNLDNYQNLNLRFKDYINNYNKLNNKINVISNLTDLKSILLVSGSLSINSRYIKNKLTEINNSIKHIYRIDNEWNFEIDNEYDPFSLVVFENYPSSIKDINKFKQLMFDIEELDLSTIIIFGPNQDYKILKQISNLFPFDVYDEPLSNQRLTANNSYYNYDLSNFYPNNSFFKAKSRIDNKNNVYYEDGSSAISYGEDNHMFIFYPNIGNIAYKSNEFNTDNFGEFIADLFTNMYHRSLKAELFVNRNEFYNNEEIEVKLLYHLNTNLNDTYLHIIDSNGDRKIHSINNEEYHLKKQIIKPGDYILKLVELEQDNEESVISNAINIKVRDYTDAYPDENDLIGKNEEFLNRIAIESHGEYLNKENYLEKIESHQSLNKTITYYQEKYDSKNYIFILMVSIIMLIIEWYFRKKKGLL